MDTSKILNKLRKKDKKRGLRISLYLKDPTLWDRFRKACEDVNPSAVVASFMEEFASAADKKRR